MCAVAFALRPQWLMIPSGVTCLDLSGLPGLSMEMDSAPILLPHGQAVESVGARSGFHRFSHRRPGLISSQSPWLVIRG